MMMRRITLFVAAVAAYTLLGMAFVSAAKLNDKPAKLTDENADWAGPMETTHYKCPGDVFDDVSYGHGHFMSDADRYVIVIDSIRPRRENDRRKGVRLPVIRVDVETGTVTFNGRRCRPDIRSGEGE
jgi:hypothetical protein